MTSLVCQNKVQDSLKLALTSGRDRLTLRESELSQTFGTPLLIANALSISSGTIYGAGDLSRAQFSKRNIPTLASPNLARPELIRWLADCAIARCAGAYDVC